jgi:glycosyltransferase involved in cell wall biosynthesis
MDTLFSLDPTAVPAIKTLSPAGLQVLPLVDPADLGDVTRPRQEVRALHGVEGGRVLLLLFGALDERKGVFTLLDALTQIPASIARRMAVMLAGRPSSAVDARLRTTIAELQRTTEAQILLHDGFVPDDEVQNLIAAADVVLAPYFRHVGSSGILMRAAAAGRPVLSQDWGLMGWQVRTHLLGTTTDTTNPASLSSALADVVANPLAGFDQDAAAAFVADSTVERYTTTILNALLPGTRS